MAYSLICNEKYYLIWDADTVPLKTYNINNISFDVKTEYREAYFETINRLFPELKKRNNFSFISEHMMIETSIMKELITKIQNIEKSSSFWENILKNVSDDELSGAGFSEFETYGTYTTFYYPEKYKIKKWHSLRDGNNWLTYDRMNESIEDWLKKKFDAVSFDSWQDFDEKKSDFYLKMSKTFPYGMTVILYKIYRKLKKIVTIEN